MPSNDAAGRYRDDESVLASIGAHLNAKDLGVTVRVPVALADMAVAAWQRDELDDDVEESEAQRRVGDRAASLALISLAVEERGVRDGDVVVVSLHVSWVGDAIAAAHDRGLISQG